MKQYNGPERRSEPPISPVSIDAVRNGAQDDVDELLMILRHLLRWAKWVSLVASVGVISFIFYAGAWYFKVNDHIETDVMIDKNQDEIIAILTEKQARALGILEGMDRRLELLEDKAE